LEVAEMEWDRDRANKKYPRRLHNLEMRGYFFIKIGGR